jgi:flagellar biosynthetic protein FliQ
MGQSNPMNGVETLEIGRDAILVLFKISLPLMMITLVVGLSVSVLQTVTQIQEATLTFVPKIVVIFIALYMLLPFIGASLNDFTLMIADRIVHSQ